MSDAAKPETKHFTLRGEFAVLVGLLVLALYALWAAYGAAPTSLSFLTEMPDEPRAVTPMAGMDAHGASMGGMVMAGHGVGTGTMTPEEFHEITVKFTEDLSLPDGSVRPTREWMEAMRAMEAGGEAMEAHAEATDAHPEAEATDAHAEEEATDAHAETEAAGPAAEDEPIDVYLMAMRFYYHPQVLRLERDVPYRFRVMSMEVTHGVSIHTGFAGHIMRRPARVLAEMVMTFPEKGEFMVYCTVYCGAGHDQMKGKIIVE